MRRHALRKSPLTPLFQRGGIPPFCGLWGRIFILDNAGLFGLSSLSGLSGLSGFFSLFGPSEIGFTFHGINLFGLFLFGSISLLRLLSLLGR